MIGEQTFGIRTRELEEKARALESLVIVAERMGSALMAYCDRVVETVLPLLRF